MGNSDSDTGKSVSEALILESDNPQYDKICLLNPPKNTSSEHVVYKYCFECQNKKKKQFLYTTCSKLVFFGGIQWTISFHIVG